MNKMMGLLLLVLALAVIVAGCSSSSGVDAQPTANPEKQAALNTTLEKAALVDDLQGACVEIDSAIQAASFLPPPTLNKSVVDGYVASVDAYMTALADYKSASARYRTFLDNGSADYRQALDNETAADTKLTDAGNLKKEPGLVNDWLGAYDTWKPINDTAGERIKEMLYLASLTDPYHQSSPAEGIRFFNEARPQFIAYLNESGNMINRTDALIAVLNNSTAKDSLLQFKGDVQSMNGWVRTNFNQMVATFNDLAGKKYGMQAGL